MRLNKFISETGACSRREADAWISAGRVTVNGKQAALGTQVTGEDVVLLDGKALAAGRKDVYLLLNKPRGITCTTERDVAGNIVDFIGHRERIFPIGRLDKDSQGLILLPYFLGEKTPRVLKIKNGVEVKIEGDIVVISSPNREFGGQTAASIEVLTTRADYDKRIFQDGIYITEKPAREK